MSQLVWSATAVFRETRALERSAALPSRSAWVNGQGGCR
jgi:hypothetical protein